MNTGGGTWQIVPYEGDSLYKKSRVRDQERIRTVLRHLHAMECVALLGPPLSEKSRLLHDVAEHLQQGGLFNPLYLDLWRAQSTDEASFFTSTSRLIAEGLGLLSVAPPEKVADARSFQNYLGSLLTSGQETGAAPEVAPRLGAGANGRHLALLIDHLQALPPDLVHSLLLALRSAYMERPPEAPNQLVAVVTGGMNLVGLSTGPTSPFNIARPVVAGPLTKEQTLALAQATGEAHGCRVSPAALERIAWWACGDRYLIARLGTWTAEAVRDHRRPLVTRTVVERAVERVLLTDAGLAPIREAIRMIEEDPDTLLDVLDLLDQGWLPRSSARQTITRTGTDRLQLSGAVVLDASGNYRLKNEAYRVALTSHFTSERVGHVLRIAGRWREAIDYLAPRMDQPLQDPSGQAGARPQLLEAIVQAVYTTDSPERAAEILARGLLLGFGLGQVAIYRFNPAQGLLMLAYPAPPSELPASALPISEGQSPHAKGSAVTGTRRWVASHESTGRGMEPPASEEETPTSSVPRFPIIIDLHSPESVEVQTLRYGGYALRGTATEARLVAALTTPHRPIGIVTVERYVEDRDPHVLPDELPDLLRFLQHAAVAMENVIVRAAYRAIGQAVLSASTLQPALTHVLEAVSEALGCDFATLYLVDDQAAADWRPATGGQRLHLVAGTGRPWSPEWRTLVHVDRDGQHPAALCLAEGQLLSVRGSDRRLPAVLVDRYGLRDYGLVYLPLQATSEQAERNRLGVLEMGFSSAVRLALAEETRRTMATFADQVAIAVHNMELLRRTDEALARTVEEITVGRRIQLSMLPKDTPAVPGWQFAATYQAAHIVGGDFYDFYDLPGKPERLGLVIADVADKGVPAALFMALSRTIIRTTALSGRGPASALLRANGLILNDSASDLFLSAVYAALEVETGRLVYANAGHNRPLWYRAATGYIDELPARGTILGVIDEIRMEERRLDVAPGDVLVFYTDGITEAVNAEGEFYDEERLRRTLAAHSHESAQQILDAIIGALESFIGDTEPADDITCVVVKRTTSSIEAT